MHPRVGFGVFKIPPDRHIDTPAMYGNERETGRAVAESGVPRDELYLVTKLWNSEQGYGSTLAAFDASMKRLGIDILDLYLVHWAMPKLSKFVDTCTAFAHLRDKGRIRSIGVSNFQPEHINALVDATGIVLPSTRSSCLPGFRKLSYGSCTPTSESRPRHGVGSGSVRC